MVTLKIKTKNGWVDQSQYVQLPVTVTETLDETMDRAELMLNFTDISDGFEPYSFAHIIIEDKEMYMIVESDVVEEVNRGTESYFKHMLTFVEATQYLSTMDINDFSITQSPEFYIGDQYSPRVGLSSIPPYNDKFWGTENDLNAFRDTGQIYTTNISGTFPLFFPDRLFGGIYKLDFELSQVLFKNVYAKNNPDDLFISLPSVVDNNAFVRLDYRVGTTFYNIPHAFAERSIKIAYEEILINKTTNTTYSISSLIDSNRRINLKSLPNGAYRYTIRARQDFWNHPDNAGVLSNNLFLDPIFVAAFSLQVIIIGGGLLSSGVLTNEAVFNQRATVENICKGIDYRNTNGFYYQDDRLFEEYYDFEIVSEADDAGYQIKLVDVLLKALYNTKLVALKDARYYRQVTQSEFNQLDKVTQIGPIATEITNPELLYGPAYTQSYRTGIVLFDAEFNFSYFYVDSSVARAEIDLVNTFENPFNSNIYYTDRFTFRYDDKILERAKSIPSLDFTFSGGRNLLEVLFELGKMIKGIPRVYFDNNLNPVISFDILEEMLNNPSFSDSPTLIKKESNTSNYATNVISELKNAILDDSIGFKSANSVVYPSIGGWIAPRALGFDEALVKPDTMTIAIDNQNQGIYRVLKLFVTNFNSSGKIADITDYVFEKTIFDSLENRADRLGNRIGKGMALFYERGGTEIQNLNELADPDNVFGWTGTKYSIVRILQDLNTLNPGQNFSPQTLTYPEVQYKYRVEYVPLLTDSRVVIEQSNVTSESNPVNMPFNQTERNVSMQQFAKAADITLKRNGIPSIHKNYNFNSIDQVPFLGQEIEFDGYKYYADKITFSYDNNNVQAEVQFSRDVNKVDPVVGFNREYREYSLTQDNVVWKRGNLNDYIFITGDNTYASMTNIFSPSKSSIPKSFSNSLDSNRYSASSVRIDKAVFNFYDLRGEIVNWRDGAVQPMGLSLVSSPVGTSLMFTTSMYDNFAAGRKLSKIPYDPNASVPSAILNLIASDGSGNEKNRLNQFYVRYVDENGRAPVGKVLFLTSNSDIFDSLRAPELSQQYHLYEPSAVLSETFLFDKDNREALQLTYQIHGISKDKDITIKPALFKYNKIATNIASLPAEAQPGNAVLVGVRNINSLRNADIYNYDPVDVLQSPVFTLSGEGGINTNQVGLVGNNLRNLKGRDYEGVAVVFSNTKEIAILRNKYIANSDFVGAIYMTFSEKVL